MHQHQKYMYRMNTKVTELSRETETTLELGMKSSDEQTEQQQLLST